MTCDHRATSWISPVVSLPSCVCRAERPRHLLSVPFMFLLVLSVSRPLKPIKRGRVREKGKASLSVLSQTMKKNPNFCFT